MVGLSSAASSLSGLRALSLSSFAAVKAVGGGDDVRGWQLISSTFQCMAVTIGGPRNAEG